MEGQFTLSWITKIFTSAWFAAAGAFAVAMPVIGYVYAPDEDALPGEGLVAGLFFSVAAMAFARLGLGFVRSSKKLSSQDSEIIERHILSTMSHGHGGG